MQLMCGNAHQSGDNAVSPNKANTSLTRVMEQNHIVMHGNYSNYSNYLIWDFPLIGEN